MLTPRVKSCSPEHLNVLFLDEVLQDVKNQRKKNRLSTNDRTMN